MENNKTSKSGASKSCLQVIVFKQNLDSIQLPGNRNLKLSN